MAAGMEHCKLAGYSACDEGSSNTPSCQAGAEPVGFAPAPRLSNGVRVELTKLAGKEFFMLYWALIFLVIAIIAAIFGFSGIAVASAGIAKILFFIFIVIFVVMLIAHLGRRGSSI